MGYIGLYHRFKALPEDQVCCEQTFKDDNVLGEYSVQSGSHIQALEKSVPEDQVQVTNPLDSISMQRSVTNGTDKPGL